MTMGVFDDIPAWARLLPPAPEKPKKPRGRPKGVKDSKPRKPAAQAKLDEGKAEK